MYGSQSVCCLKTHGGFLTAWTVVWLAWSLSRHGAITGSDERIDAGAPNEPGGSPTHWSGGRGANRTIEDAARGATSTAAAQKSSHANPDDRYEDVNEAAELHRQTRRLVDLCHGDDTMTGKFMDPHGRNWPSPSSPRVKGHFGIQTI